MLIHSDNALRRFCEAVRNEPFCAVDTEFLWQRTYWPEPGLVQLAVPGRAAAVDVLAVDDLTPIGELLAAPTLLKVLHAGAQDVGLLHRLTGVGPRPVFDTQIAAALAGIGSQVSYALLVEHFLGIRLDKSEQYTDWVARPLRPEQVRYAADDVRHLADLYPLLRSRLSQSGRLAWAVEDCATLASAAFLEPPAPAEAFRSIKGHGRLGASDLAALAELARWREEHSLSVDLRPRRVVPDHLLLRFAVTGRLLGRDFHKVRRAVAKRVRNLEPEMAAAAARGRALPAGQRPVVHRFGAATPAERRVVKEAIGALRETAEHLGVPADSLATRWEITMLVRSLHRRKDEPELRMLGGWRRPVFGERILGFVRQALGQD